MPSTTPKQRRFFGAELGRERAGKQTVTGLPETKLKDFAKAIKPKAVSKPKKKLNVPPGTPKLTPNAPNPPIRRAKSPVEMAMAVKRPNPFGQY